MDWIVSRDHASQLRHFDLRGTWTKIWCKITTARTVKLRMEKNPQNGKAGEKDIEDAYRFRRIIMNRGCLNYREGAHGH